MLSGTVVADETYVGGSFANRHKGKRTPQVTYAPNRHASFVASGRR